LWSNSSVESRSRGRSSYKSAGYSNSRSLSGKNRQYFSFKATKALENKTQAINNVCSDIKFSQPGVKNDHGSYLNYYYTKYDLEKDLKYRASNYKSCSDNDKENFNGLNNSRKPSLRPKYSFVEDETNQNGTFSDTNMSILNKWESISLEDSRDLKPNPPRLKKLFQQPRHSMFPKIPLKDNNHKNKQEKDIDNVKVEHEIDRIYDTISQFNEAKHYGPFPNSSNTTDCLKFFNFLLQKLLKHNKKCRRKLRNQSRSNCHF
jgi:hypothetical protein